MSDRSKTGRPPKTPPHSDITGVNRGTGATPSLTRDHDDDPDPGKEQLQHEADNKGRPPHDPPPVNKPEGL
jgi:hypothetical protein